jgi:hypothetical protein
VLRNKLTTVSFQKGGGSNVCRSKHSRFVAASSAFSLLIVVLFISAPDFVRELYGWLFVKGGAMPSATRPMQPISASSTPFNDYLDGWRKAVLDGPTCVHGFHLDSWTLIHAFEIKPIDSLMKLAHNTLDNLYLWWDKRADLGLFKRIPEPVPKRIWSF